MNAFDRAHIGEILQGERDERWSYFTARLLRLIAHADATNLLLLGTVYPEEVTAYLEWRERGRD